MSEPPKSPPAVDPPCSAHHPTSPSSPPEAVSPVAATHLSLVPAPPALAQVPRPRPVPRPGPVSPEVSGPVSVPAPVASSGAVDSFTPSTISTDEPRVLDGKYVLERRVGEGGMGAVYIAHHLRLRHTVAVKLMHGPALADEVAVKRFVREARAMAALDHPNIVRVHDFGVDGGAPYIAMEYLRGSSLGDLLDGSDTYLPLARVRDLLAAVLDGLAAVHEKGIVHRDLKPDNIFLTDTPQGEVVKLVDFGLARMDDGAGAPALTQTSAVSGTPDYMSPEQCQSLKVGPETDIYAVGCLLTALLQLYPPFAGAGGVVEVMTRQMFTAPPKLARPTGAEPVPAALEELRLDLLAKNAGDRPRSALEVKRRLLEAFDAASAGRRLTSRRIEQEESRGDHRSASTPPAALSTQRPASGTCLFLCGPRATRADLTTPLATQGLLLIDDPAQPHGAVLFDAGDDHAAAVAFLAARKPGGAPVLVAVAGLDVPRINALIAAGAADALGSPVDPTAFAKKLSRILRRRRLGTALQRPGPRTPAAPHHATYLLLHPPDGPRRALSP